jgi:hypothetical protein
MREIPNLLDPFHILVDVDGHRTTTANDNISFDGKIYLNDNALISISPISISDLKQNTYDMVFAIIENHWTGSNVGDLTGKPYSVLYYWPGISPRMLLISAGRITAVNTLFKTDSIGERLLKLSGSSPTYLLDEVVPTRIAKGTLSNDSSFDRMDTDFKKITFRWGFVK